MRVRPIAGTPLATGNLTRAGTATMAAVTAGSTGLGGLTEVAGAANRLAFSTQPGNATAGADLGTQPVIRARDQFGNNSTNGLPASKLVTLTLTAGTGPLLGTSSLDIGTAAGNSVATFADLEIDSSGNNKQLTASAAGFTNAVSSVFTINAAVADHLAVQTQPSSTATAGAAFATQPVVRIEDAFGNLCTGDNATVVSASRNAGSGVLQGATNRAAVGGLVSYTNLSHTVAGTITIDFAGGSLAGATSGNVVVSPAAASRLTIQTQPSSTATAGVAFAQQPVLRIEDQFGNLRSSDNSTVVTASRNGGSGTLQGTTSRATVNGIVAFLNLSHNVANDISLAFASSGLTGANSGAVSVSPAPADRLLFTVQPGSTTYGSVLSTAPVVRTQDQFGNDSTVGIGPSKFVSLAVSSGSLQGTTSVDIGTSAGNGTASFPGLKVSTVGTGKQLTASVTSGLSSALSSAFDVAKATVTANITANGKIYDGTTNATIANRALTGVIGADAVSLSGDTASFASKSVGTGKTVTAIGLSLSGADAGNYQLASTTATALADITTRPLAVGATGVNKPYDGTTTATATLSDNRLSGDSLSTSYGSASFAGKNVGTAKGVSVSGITVTGTDAANYAANTTASATADITARSLTVSATGANRVYDSTTNASVSLSDNRLAGDTLSASYVSATFANKNVGTAKPVSVSGISLSGTDAANYTANTTATTTANITARALSVSASGANKVYDGTTNASVTLSDNRVASDTLSTSYTSASFANKNAGTTKTVSVGGIAISGTDAANYTANTTASTTADITARSLAVSATGVNKVYNGSTTATVTLSDNRVTGDTLSTSYTSANFADKNAGTSKPVNVSGISVTGTDAANYIANATASTTADITKATVSALITADNKTYDATTAATIATRSLTGVLGSDDLSLSGGTASFSSKTVGTAKPVTAGGLSLSGADAANYQLSSTTANTTADITARALLVTATGVNKVYDGTTAATATLTDNRVAGDVLSASSTSATFANKNVGTAKLVNVSGISISGADALNYSANTTASATADITTRSLTVSATGVSRTYDGSTNAAVTLSDNRVAADSLSTSYTTASFADKNAGTSKTVTVAGISTSGTDAANYTANTTASTTANITAKALTVTGITANDKVYNGTTTATLNSQLSTLNGVISGDTVTPNSASVTGAFADKNVGSNKTVNVSGVALSGTDAANYSVTQPTTTANITKAILTVIADNKTRTSTASNPALTATYTNFVGGETLATSGVTGSPALSSTTTNVAGTYPITLSAGTLSAGNYSFTFVDGVLTVTADAATKLLVLLPGETAAPGTSSGKTGSPLAQVAGAAIANGIVVNAVDVNWNLVSSSVPSVTLTTTDANASIADDNGGTTGNMSLVSGTRTLSSLTFKTAGTRTLTATATGLTSSTSGNVTVSPGAFSKLQLLVPGETAAPGTATGKTGTPSAQIVGVSFGATVNAVDANWNLLNTVSDVVDLSSSDLSAALPPDAPLVAGTGTFTIAFGTNGSFTLSATDSSDGTRTASTSPAITVTPAQFTPATGGGAIAADGATGTFTTLTGPTYTENASGNVGTGTIILAAPAGFIFDTGGTAPTVVITRIAGSGNNGNNINDVASGTAAAITSRTTNQIVFTVAAPSASGVTCRLTWQNVRLRPTAGTPLASGNLARGGTATVVGLPANVNLGALREVAGSASSLVIQTQPSSTATAGVAFAQQPVLKVLDQFGTLRSTANGVSDSTAVTAARGAGSGSLQGTTSRTAVNGVVTFTNLSHNVANSITLAFSATGLSGTNSSTIAVSPAAADRLVFATQPGSTTYGSLLGAQPVLKTQDPFGNDSTVGLPFNLNLNLILNTGTGSLQGTTSVDIGTGAGNGTAAFSGLSVNAAGTAKQLTASVSGLTSALSSSFDVAKATVTASITASSKTYDGTTASAIATRSLTGVLGGDAVSLSGDTATFASKTVGTGKTVTATGLSLSGADAGDYQLASTTATALANITARSLVVSATGANKAYDGTTGTTVTLSDNRVSGDSLSTTYGGASFADRNVGTAKSVNVTAITVTGTDASNYAANTTASTTADITARSLTVSATGVNRVYDGTTNASVTLSDNRVAGDTLSTAYVSAGFANKNVGTAKTVSVSGITLSGADAANYTANTTATTTANITARALSVSASGVNRVYDGTTNASVTLSDNRISGDALSTSYTSASFANKNVGPAKTVSVGGIAISGTDATNYTANTTASTTADITARTLTVTATAGNKVYDGTANATVTLSDNRVTGDTLSTSYSSTSFADKNAGTAKTVTVNGISISGTDSANYAANATAATTANITAKGLTVSGITANNKVYDATTAATLNAASATLTGVVSGDTVSVNSGSAAGTFADKNVGTGKAVSVSGVSLSGSDAGNYSLTQPSTTASITKAALTVTADDKTRAAGAPNPSLTVTYSGFVGGETVASSGVTGAPTLSATTTNLAGIYPITVTAGTLNSANYSFSYVNGQLTIAPASTSKLVFATTAQTMTAGVTSGTITVQRQDAYNNPNTTDGTLTVNLSSDSTGLYAFHDGADISTISSALIPSGSSSASFKYNDPKAGTPTITAAASGLSNATQLETVNAGPFVKLQLLVPGETAAPGTATGKSGTPNAQGAGSAFNAIVNAVDANWNLVINTHTVGITSIDPNATLPANGALSAGTRTVSVTLKTAGSQTLAVSDITDNTKTASTSPSITVTGGPATRLTIQTQPSSSTTAGIPFAQQPVIRVEDAMGNLVNTNGLVVTAARATGTSTLQGSLTAITVNGVATFTNLSYNLAETITLNFTASGLTGASSGNTVVNPAAFTKLQLLVPGETAAPGSASGKTGTPTATTAGTAFNVTVRAVDAFWNLVNSATDMVDTSSTDTNAVLPADTALVSGTKTLSVALKSAGTPTITVSDVDDPSKAGNASPAITVNAGAMAKLQLLVPGETAAPGSTTGKTGTPSVQTANVGYNVTVRAVDANWNLVNSSTHTVGITCTDPNDLLPANAALVAGTKSFSLTNKTAGSWTITATDITDGTKTANTSPSLTVNSGAFTKLQILMPGETAAPGTTAGKTGTPTARTAGTAFNITVNAVDANWNVATIATDTVALISSDANATLPANTALVSGTQTLSVTFKTAGTRTLTTSDVTDGAKTSNTSPSVTVSVGAFAKLQVLVPGETAAPGSVTGKTGTPTSQPMGTAFNVTVNAVDASWNLVNTITHTVGIASSDSTATLPANGALTAGTRTASVTLRTAGAQTVTASDITDGTKTANTSSPVIVNAGAATKLTIQTQPSPTATAGVPFAQQPIVRVEDSAGNLISTDNGRLITATRSAGTGTLQGTVTATTVNGIATFTDLSHNVATILTINFTASGLTGATSGNVNVSPASASQLVLTTQPSGTRTGSSLATQPVVKTQDAYGNTSSVGLPASLSVSLAVTGGSGTLLGTTSLDIGTAAGNGTATFTTVQCSDAGRNKQITASATGLADAVSSLFTLYGVERATGGTDIPSSTAGGAYTPLTGPVYYEYANGDVGTGTIILNAPAGFVFDTAGTAPTVRIDRLAGTGNDSKNINGVATGTSAAITSRTTTQVTFTVGIASSSGVTCSLTWQNIRVRPTASSPLASGNITRTGTSTMAVVANGSTSFGALIETGAIGPASYNAVAVSGQPTSLTGIKAVPAGIEITFTGSPVCTYQIQRATALQDGASAWEQAGTATTDAAGQGEFTDRNPTSRQGYYRTVSVGQGQGGLLK